MALRASGDAAYLLELAIRAAREGGREIARQDGRPSLNRSTAVDPTTETDLASAAAIRTFLAAERPYDGLLVEGGVGDAPSSDTFRWVVDPVDGTVNHVYGIPHASVSIACEVQEAGEWRTVVGVVHDPYRNETFTAVRGLGAELNGVAISAHDTADLSRALIATEFSYRSSARSGQAAVLSRLLPEVRDVRITGSSALDLCWTAAGRFDGFYEDELHRWDWAAGALIVREARGSVSELGSGLLASGPTLHSDLRLLVCGDKEGS